MVGIGLCVGWGYLNFKREEPKSRFHFCGARFLAHNFYIICGHWGYSQRDCELAFYSQEDDSGAQDEEEICIVHNDQESVLGLGESISDDQAFPTACCRHCFSVCWYPDPSEGQHPSANTLNRAGLAQQPMSGLQTEKLTPIHLWKWVRRICSNISNSYPWLEPAFLVVPVAIPPPGGFHLAHQKKEGLWNRWQSTLPQSDLLPWPCINLRNSQQKQDEEWDILWEKRCVQSDVNSSASLHTEQVVWESKAMLLRVCG